jgi:hypothetical protein
MGRLLEVVEAAEAELMTFEKVTGGRSSRSSFQIAWAGAEVTWFRTDSCKILDLHKKANKNRSLKGTVQRKNELGQEW